MKICVFGTRGFPLIQGGVEKHCEHLYPRIARHSDTEVIVYRRKPYVVNSQDKSYPGICFIDLPSTKIKGFEALFHSLLSSLNALKQHPDIVHIHNIGPALFTPLLRLFGKKIVLTYHSANYEHKKWNAIEQAFLRISEKLALKYAHAIIFVNHFQMNKFDDRILQKSCYIPNGIEKPVFSHSSEYMEKWGINNTKYILAVGRITPEKGFDILIKAFSSIDTEFKLVIAGGTEAETEYYNELTVMAANKDIIFTGVIHGEELYQLYTNAQLFVIPSISEGFPIVLLEAMSYNLPVIASDIPATHLVSLPPKCYFPTGNHEALAKKITDFINTPQPKPSYDLSPYDWGNIAKQTMEVFKSV